MGADVPSNTDKRLRTMVVAGTMQDEPIFFVRHDQGDSEVPKNVDARLGCMLAE